MRQLVWIGAMAACSSARPPTPTQLDEGHRASRLIAAGDTLYFASDDGGLWSQPVDGSAPAVLRLANAPMPFELVGTDLLALRRNADTTQDLIRQPLAGGPPVIVAAGVPLGALGINSTSAVVVGLDVVRIPLSGGAPVAIGSGANDISGIAIDENSVYWLEPFNAPCTEQPLDGGLALTFRCHGNHQVVVAGDAMYTTYGCDQQTACGEVAKTDLATLQTKTLATPAAVTGIAVSDGHVYWSEPSRIVRANLDGSEQTVLAQLAMPGNLEDILAMAVGPTEVFWSTHVIAGASAIWSAPK